MRSISALFPLVLLAAHGLVGCGSSSLAPDAGTTSETAVDARLPDGGDHLTIPIRVGEKAFNETLNDGFLESVEVSWTASSLLLTSGGKVSATLEASYAGPIIFDALEVQDALFWTVNGETVWDYYGDYSSEAWAPITGVRATSSTTTTASFHVEGTFRVPPPEQRNPEGRTLRSAGFDLTWVRAWVTPSGVRYQVLAGAGPALAPGSTVAFDEPAPSPCGGRFLYYQARPAGAPASNQFNYVGWFGSH